MEDNNTENIESIKQILLINDEMESKPKANLTKKVEESITQTIEDSLQAQGSIFFDKLDEFKESWSSPVKQGIVNYFISRPVNNEFAPRIIDLLKKYRGRARDRDLLQYLTILGLLHYAQFDDQDGPILHRWIKGTRKNKKAISFKFAELFNGQDIQYIVSVLAHCKVVLQSLESESFEKLKKLASDAILAITFESNRDDILKSLDSLCQLMKSGFWVPSAKDDMLISNIDGFREKSEKSSVPELKVDTPRVTPNSFNLMNPELRSGYTQNGAHIPVRMQSNTPKPLQKPKDIRSDAEKTFTDFKEHDRHLNTIRAREKTISVNNLSNKQEESIKNLIKIISDLNTRTSRNQEKATNLKRELEFLKKKRDDLSEEVKIYQEDNQEKQTLLDELRRRLSHMREEHEQDKIDWRRKRSELESEIAQEKLDRNRLKESLKISETQLGRERLLSHATHKDAVNRADVELETKIKTISQSVSPIFKEIEDFETIEDLPQRARMLLNINRKIKNALQANGVKL